jgi:hypothetical protein
MRTSTIGHEHHPIRPASQPYTVFDKDKVASLMPALRHTSSTRVPSSACRKMKAICCSLNRDFFMENPPSGQDV